MARLLTTIVLLLAGAFANAAEGLDFNQWGLLAIQEGGRRKPIDTFAKETLLRLSGKATYKSGNRTWTANDFLLSNLLETHDWKKEPLILVGYRPLVETLGLDSTRKRFSPEELAGTTQLLTLAQKAHDLEKESKEVSRDLKEAESVVNRMDLFSKVATGSLFTIVPPAEGNKWLMPTDLGDSYPNAASVNAHLSALASAYVGGDNFNFNLHSSQLRQSLRQLNATLYPTEAKLKLEYFYNHISPFDWAMLLYAIALVGLWMASVTPSLVLARFGGLGCAIGGLLFHAGGIALRCIIAGRPPVTNMFESVVWVSFGVMAFGFAFFFRYRTVTYLLAALPVSFLCLVLLRQLPVAMPENIDPLVPVLRSNFWLTIHVLTITLSYAAFALAMGFGHIVLYRFIKNPRAAAANVTLHFWLYRVLQLGVLLLATGTILGGVWANYSWGRFWGWDPKETWALIALLCYIFVLHGRIVGWWDQFGLAVSSVVCFCAVMMTWYGVNFVLGKGLHSYGFGIGGEQYVATFVVLDLAYVAMACWRRHKSRNRDDSRGSAASQPILEI
ncbi:MAG: hypothetical protein QOD99_1262 [Chthoniobacter sp.]|jgi:cytochrome c-type biogenesis protein CcsB|nr:hypothetical protein [Chthoniobacter sp.]